jgi:small subunit ribosomal protein S20
MANTKSAERRARSSARRYEHNRAAKSRLKTLQSRFLRLLSAGKKEEAGQTLRLAVSALDKAAKTGVIPKGRADRKKARLAARLNALQAAS